MAIRTAWLVMVGCLLLPATVESQNPPEGGLRLVGSAELTGKVLRLTPAERHKAGAAWFEERQVVSSGFTAASNSSSLNKVGSGRGQTDSLLSCRIADRMRSAALDQQADSGWGLAALRQSTGNSQSLAVFFDTIRNPEIGDPSGNYIAICTAGRPRQMKWPPPRLA